uniref:Uncharacterized protein n=1 Tax=Opuntia streptacantha TaxID=393608 RepID=A0A7C9DJ77_OPUST
MVQEVNGIPNQALLITEGVKYFAKLRCPLQPVVPFFSLLTHNLEKDGRWVVICYLLLLLPLLRHCNFHSERSLCLSLPACLFKCAWGQKGHQIVLIVHCKCKVRLIN